MANPTTTSILCTPCCSSVCGLDGVDRWVPVNPLRPRRMAFKATFTAAPSGITLTNEVHAKYLLGTDCFVNPFGFGPGDDAIDPFTYEGSSTFVLTPWNSYLAERVTVDDVQIACGLSTNYTIATGAHDERLRGHYWQALPDGSATFTYSRDKRPFFRLDPCNTAGASLLRVAKDDADFTASRGSAGVNIALADGMVHVYAFWVLEAGKYKNFGPSDVPPDFDDWYTRREALCQVLSVHAEYTPAAFDALTEIELTDAVTGATVLIEPWDDVIPSVWELPSCYDVQFQRRNMIDWVDSTGMPADCPISTSSHGITVRMQRDEFGEYASVNPSFFGFMNRSGGEWYIGATTPDDDDDGPTGPFGTGEPGDNGFKEFRKYLGVVGMSDESWEPNATRAEGEMHTRVVAVDPVSDPECGYSVSDLYVQCYQFGNDITHTINDGSHWISFWFNDNNDGDNWSTDWWRIDVYLNGVKVIEDGEVGSFGHPTIHEGLLNGKPTAIPGVYASGGNAPAYRAWLWYGLLPQPFTLRVVWKSGRCNLGTNPLSSTDPDGEALGGGRVGVFSPFNEWPCAYGYSLNDPSGSPPNPADPTRPMWAYSLVGRTVKSPWLT